MIQLLETILACLWLVLKISGVVLLLGCALHIVKHVWGELFPKREKEYEVHWKKIEFPTPPSRDEIVTMSSRLKP